MTANDEVAMESTIQQALQKHLFSLSGSMDASTNHVCSKDCVMQELNVLYTYDKVAHRLRICVNCCSDQANKKHLKCNALHNLYICTTSAHLHLCGIGKCKLPCGHATCEDGSYACLLTGLVVDSGDWVAKCWQEDDREKASIEHASWNSDRRQNKRRTQADKIWHSQFEAMRSEIVKFQTLLCELLPGGIHSRRIQRKVKYSIMKKYKLRAFAYAKSHLANSKCGLNLFKIRDIILSGVQRCHIEFNGLHTMQITQQQRRSISNAYTAAIFNLYTKLTAFRWTRVKDGNAMATPGAPKQKTLARTGTNFIQFGFNMLMILHSGFAINNVRVVQQDDFIKCAVPCVHHIIKDSHLTSVHPYIRHTARSTKRILNLLKSQKTLHCLEAVDAHASACSNLDLQFLVNTQDGLSREFCL